MVETVSSLVALSDAAAQLVERAAGSIVSVRGSSKWIRGRRPLLRPLNLAS
jgi:hypothetical protein